MEMAKYSLLRSVNYSVNIYHELSSNYNVKKLSNKVGKGNRIGYR